MALSRYTDVQVKDRSARVTTNEQRFSKLKEITMESINSLLNLTQVALNDLQNAFQECQHAAAEGMILSALVKVKQLHEALIDVKECSSDLEPEEFCCAV
jgi:hypothetical protein